MYPDEFVEEERVVLIDLMQAIDPKDILYVSLAKKLSLPLFTLDK